MVSLHRLERATDSTTPGDRAPRPLLESPRFSLAELAGRLVELTAVGDGAPLTHALTLVHEAQESAEPAAWVTTRGNLFYPPDAAAGGVDLAALPVIRVVDAPAAGRAADKLMRSGAFGLVVVDIGATPPHPHRADAALPSPLLARLAGLARRHHCTLLFLTEQESDRSRLGSLISMRVESTRRREEGRFVCELHALKDRHRGPGWREATPCRPVAGL